MSDENTNPADKKATEDAVAVTPQKEAPANGPAASEDGAADENQDKKRRGGRPQRGNRRKENKEFEETIIGVDRVTRVTAGGRQMRFRVTVAIGDKKGRVGFGMGKSSEVMIGVQKGIAQAKKRMITVPIFEDSIPHPVSFKFKATKVFLLPAPEGKGVIAGGTVRKILELAGVKNVLSKIHGSRNKVTTAYATMGALKKLINAAPHTPKSQKVAEDTEEPKNQKPVEKKEDVKKKAPAKASKVEAKKATKKT
ncbi:MAG TPA: 30S ribosomal protein S5 [Candidatus Gracilibacteria bacterium]